MLFYYYFSVGNSIMTNCRGQRKYGTNINIDFVAISHPCTCNVLPSFAGHLLITSREVTNVCKTQIIVKKIHTEFIYGCKIPEFISQTLYVNINQSVEVRAEYVSRYTSGTFSHCIGFQQNGKYVFLQIQKLAFTRNDRCYYSFNVFIVENSKQYIYLLYY